MANRTARASKPRETADFGPREARRHADWVMPAGIRRVQRYPVHDQLYAAGAISAAIWDAARCYADDYALAAGAREGGAVAIRTNGANLAPNAAQIAAIGRLRAIRARIGTGAARVCDLACGESMSVADLRRTLHATDARATLAIVRQVLALLAGARIDPGG